MMKKKETKKMPKKIPTEVKQKAMRLYRNGEMQIVEIANLLGMAESTLTKLYCEAFNEGKLTPRRAEIALKPRPQKGKGKSRYVPVSHKYVPKNKKFDDDTERQIASDYYENGLTITDLKAKWNCHPMQLQRIRDKYGDQYGIKKMGRPKKRELNGNEEVCYN